MLRETRERRIGAFHSGPPWSSEFPGSSECGYKGPCSNRYPILGARLNKVQTLQKAERFREELTNFRGSGVFFVFWIR